MHIDEIPSPKCNRCSLIHFASLVPYFPRLFILSTTEIQKEENDTCVSLHLLIDKPRDSENL